LEHTAEECRAAGADVLALPVDATDASALEQFVEAVGQQYGRIDILVNNVGGVKKQPFVEQTERSMSRHVDINLTSMLVATHEVVPLMIAAGRGGSIVNVASIEALRAAPGFAVYAACKAGMANFSRSLALEVGAHGIRVNTLAPDIIATPGIRGLIFGPVPDPLPGLTEEAVGGIRRYVPLGSEGAPDDCAGATIFLCSKLGRYVTGTTISIDGGTLASSGWRRSAADPADWELFTG
jgi:NAD(P)-dependent dehydrogenase (short-subunit alcohol dehydrogenase family)